MRAATVRGNIYTRMTADIIAAIEARAGEISLAWHHDGGSASAPHQCRIGQASYRSINTLHPLGRRTRGVARIRALGNLSAIRWGRARRCVAASVVRAWGSGRSTGEALGQGQGDHGRVVSPPPRLRAGQLHVLAKYTQVDGCVRAEKPKTKRRQPHRAGQALLRQPQHQHPAWRRRHLLQYRPRTSSRCRQAPRQYPHLLCRVAPRVDVTAGQTTLLPVQILSAFFSDKEDHSWNINAAKEERRCEGRRD